MQGLLTENTAASAKYLSAATEMKRQHDEHAKELKLQLAEETRKLHASWAEHKTLQQTGHDANEEHKKVRAAEEKSLKIREDEMDEIRTALKKEEEDGAVTHFAP